MSDITFSCSHCRQHVVIDDPARGYQVKCPTCDGDIVVPSVPPPIPQPATVAPAPSFFGRLFGRKEPKGFDPTGTHWDSRPWKSLFVYSDNIPGKDLLIQIARDIANDDARFPFRFLTAISRKFT